MRHKDDKQEERERSLCRRRKEKQGIEDCGKEQEGMGDKEQKGIGDKEEERMGDKEQNRRGWAIKNWRGWATIKNRTGWASGKARTEDADAVTERHKTSTKE